MDQPSAAQTQTLIGRDTVTQWQRQRLLALPAAPELRQLWLCDEQFAQWPLGEPEVQAALADWLRLPGRQLGLLAQDFEALARCQPRFARWRPEWMHRIRAVRPDEDAPPWPAIGWLDERTALCWLSRPMWRARVTTDRASVAQLRRELDAFLQRCVSAWPVKALGL